MLRILKRIGACCVGNIYRRCLRPAVLATDIGGGCGVLCLLPISEVVEAYCACYIYWRWLRPAVLATYNGGG